MLHKFASKLHELTFLASKPPYREIDTAGFLTLFRFVPKHETVASLIGVLV